MVISGLCKPMLVLYNGVSYCIYYLISGWWVVSSYAWLSIVTNSYLWLCYLWLSVVMHGWLSMEVANIVIANDHSLPVHAQPLVTIQNH